MGWSVHQHPDDLVYVRQDGKNIYGDTTENFQDDFGITLPPLPEGAIERIYEPGKRHAIQSADTIIEGGPREWDLGDRIIQAVYQAVVVQQTRQPPAINRGMGLEEYTALSDEERQELANETNAAMKEWQQKEDARIQRLKK
jgi:hypothetical protein